MFKLLFKNKWMYPWAVYTPIAVYGGLSPLIGAMSLLCIWYLLNEEV